jgi:HK97 family phage major capsid protein
MPPEMLQALADALSAMLGEQIAADAASISAALDKVKTMVAVPAGGEAAAAMSPPEQAAIKAALGLDEDADEEEVIEKIEEIQQAVKHTDRVGRFDKLGDFSNQYEDAKKNAGQTFGGGRGGGGAGHPAATGESKKSSRFSAPGHTGKAGKPGIVSMLRDLKAGKSQSYQTGPTGGYILRHEVAAEFLPALRAAIPLFEMGVEEYDLDGTESLTIPKDSNTEFEAYWVGEDTEIPESNEKIGGVLLQPKPLAARVIVPNKFLSNSTVNYEQRVREKITYRLKRAIMYAALFGSGGVEGSNTGASPRGLLHTTGVTNTTLTANGRKPTFDDLQDAEGRIEDEDVELDDTTYWLFSPRTKRTFTKLTTTDGEPLLRVSMAEGAEKTLLGHEYKTTTLIPNNTTTGTSSDTSRIFLGVWRHMALGMSNQFEFMVDPYSRSSRLQTVIIAYTYVDLAVLYAQAFEIISGVRP